MPALTFTLDLGRGKAAVEWLNNIAGKSILKIDSQAKVAVFFESNPWSENKAGQDYLRTLGGIKENAEEHRKAFTTAIDAFFSK